MTQASKDAIRAAIAAYERLDGDEREIFRIAVNVTEFEDTVRMKRKLGRPRGSKNQPKAQEGTASIGRIYVPPEPE